MRLGPSASDAVQRLKSTRTQLRVAVHFPKDDLVDDGLRERLGTEIVEVTSEGGLVLMVLSNAERFPREQRNGVRTVGPGRRLEGTLRRADV
jgi:hypothetical protein